MAKMGGYPRLANGVMFVGATHVAFNFDRQPRSAYLMHGTDREVAIPRNVATAAQTHQAALQRVRRTSSGA